MPQSRGEPLVPEQANLLLCEYAKLNGGQLDIIGAGIQVMPDEHEPWAVTGTVDVAVRHVLEGIDLWVEDAASGARVDGTPTNLHIQAGEGSEELEGADPEMTARLPLILPLPHFELDAGVYFLAFSMGNVSTKLPFIVSHPNRANDEPDDAS